VTALPDWLEPLPDAAEQQALDAWAIDECGIAGVELMERAGAGLARVVAAAAPAGAIAVVCGKGNNGGDGLVAARLLREQNREVRVLLLGDAAELRGDALTNLERLPGPPIERFSAAALAGAAAVVDAILGTGFAGAPREPVASAIDAINAAEGVVLACDVPSGVDASTGEIAAAAVRAARTVTFHAAKPGLWIAPGKAHAGHVTVIDIGIPDGAPVAPSIGLIGEAIIDAVPRRSCASSKFTAGSVLVVGGSPGLTGAPSMAAMAAMRAGAGYVTAAVPRALAAVFEARQLEVMTVALGGEGGVLEVDDVEQALARVERVDSLALGPGLGREPGTKAFARDLAARATVPMVLDADGLTAHAGAAAALAARTHPTVLTPHAGELARLLGTDSEAIGAGRLASARRAAQAARAVVVLKGDDTLVVEPRPERAGASSGRVAISRGGAPALATAGTGDVLSGIVAAYLAKGMDPFTAAAAAVHVHATAGRLAAREIGSEGVIASDVISRLPRVLRDAER
jgi:ADP-dependent NAD(P)H-hydrate dehydratase / NAD(P)H-hydrate epimerase